MSSVTEPHGRRHAPGTIRAALAYRDFRIVFIGMALSFVGTWMQNFTLPAYIDDRTESAALVGLLIFVQLGPMLLLSLVGGVARRPLQPDALPDHHAGRPDGRHRRARRARRHEQSAVDAVRRGRVDRHRQRAQRTGVPGEHSVARRPRRPPRRDQPQLGGHQRQPGPRSDARGRAGRDRVLGRAGLPRQRRHVPVPHRRAGRRTHPRRAWRSPRARLAAAAHRGQHRAATRGASADRCSRCACSRCSACRSSGCSRRSPGSTSGSSPSGSTYKWLYVTWGLGAFIGALAVGTFLVAHRPPASRVDRLRDVRGEPRRVRARPLAGPGVPDRDRPGLHVLHDGDRAQHHLPAEPGRHRTGGGDAAVVHGVRRHRADRQPVVRAGDRCHRRPMGAAVRRRVRGVPRLVGRPAPAVSRCLPPRGARRRTVPARQPGSPSRVRRPVADSSPTAATGSSVGATPYRSVPTATSSMPSRRASAATSAMRGDGIVELGHHAEDRHAPTGGQARRATRARPASTSGWRCRRR